jgi:hypothetical protein
MASLADIRAKLQAAENNQGQQNRSSGGDNAIYPHWNINEGTSATIRFLPDADPNNTFFWQERNMIRLPFNGVKGEMDNKNVLVQVPCIEMWGESCPILAEVRTWFKDSSLEEMGRKYWKKKSYIFQGFVRENPIADDTTPANPIRRFIMSPQIFTIIKSSLMDPDMEELPTDYNAGLDFRVTKTQKGGYADYTTSNWARKESALSEAEQAAVNEHGLYTLADFLPKKPSEQELKVMKEMFEASVDGQPYDAERWGAYYRPAGMQAPQNAPAVSTPAPTATPVAETVATPAVETPAPEVNVAPAPEAAPAPASEPVAETASAPAGGSKAEDILAMIRSRKSS